MTRPLIRRLPAVTVFILFTATLISSTAAIPAAPGSPPFLPAVTYDTGGYQDTSVVAGDLNGDHVPDVVVTNRYCADCGIPESSIGVLLGNNDGSFQPVKTYLSGGSFANSAVIADVNGDGKPDVLVAHGVASCDPDCGGDGSVGVLLGNGDGTFQPAVTYDSGAGTQSIAVADVDADGIADLVVASDCGGADSCGSAVAVFHGNGDGSFRTPVFYASAMGGATSVAAADINRDGKIDVLVSYSRSCRRCEDSLGVLLGNGDGTFQPKVTYPGVGGGVIAVADVNGDGDPDLLVTSACQKYGDCGKGLVAVMLGNGDGTFQSPVNYDSGGYHAASFVVADVNGDLKSDLLVVNGCRLRGHQCARGNVSVLLGNGDGTFQPASTFPTGGDHPTSVAAADLNVDGRLDLLVANYGLSGGMTVGVLLNDSGPHSATTTTLESSQNPSPAGQPLTLMSTVKSENGGVVLGTVTFWPNTDHALARVPLVNGQASYTFIAKNTGRHGYTASYSGDTKNAGSDSPNRIQYIMPFPIQTILHLTASPSPSLLGQPVTFTATVTTYGEIPDGELVTFYDRNKPLVSVALASGAVSYTTSSLAAGDHYIKATYVGDEVFRKTSAHLRQIVNDAGSK
jgi:hypothetical protein